MAFTSLLSDVARVFEALGAAVLVAGLIWSVVLSSLAWRAGGGRRGYQALREIFGGVLLLGLEILVAADLIRTVAVAPTLRNVEVLRLIVLIRTFLSLSLEVEIDGQLLCVDLYAVGQPEVAAVLLWFAAGTWLFLAAVLAQRVLNEPGRFACEARSPAALTGGSWHRRAWHRVRRARLLSGSGCLAGPRRYQLGAAAHSCSPPRETPVAGESFLLTVATQGLAVLGATLAARNGAARLLIAAIAAAVLGLALYIVTVTRFALRQLLTGHGDQWIAGQSDGYSGRTWATIRTARSRSSRG
jgi:uncharacterized membrane protein